MASSNISVNCCETQPNSQNTPAARKARCLSHWELLSAVPFTFTAPLKSQLPLCPQSRQSHEHSHPSQLAQEQAALYLKAKVVVGEVSVVDDGRVQALQERTEVTLQGGTVLALLHSWPQSSGV